jgi:diketogulonate reductase-like aldo/keto reductase
MSTVTLNDGTKMPQLGYGVYGSRGSATREAVLNALELGYRSIDTAQMYRNETEVGRALRQSGVRREDIFLTTKIANSHHGGMECRRSVVQSLDRLGVDYVDLLLVHWPPPGRNLDPATWQTFESLRAAGLARSIGVSNFEPSHLRDLMLVADTTPCVNQVELTPYLTQDELRDFHLANGIVTEAWSPLGRGGQLLDDATITQIADKYDATAAQVVIAWHVAIGNVVIPRSLNRARMAENLSAMHLHLASDDTQAITKLNRGMRLGPPPCVGPDPAEFH